MRALVLGLSALLTGCTCRPALPTPTETTETDTETTGNTGTTGDTAPPPPCPVPEIEPNDSVTEPGALPMERRACGTIDAPLDLDVWEFTLEDDSWLAVEVEASSGSIADMNLLLTPDQGSWAATRADDPESKDTHLLFPAPAGVYTVTVSEQTFQGGERYGYDLLVSESKAPVDYTRAEVEPNDTQAAAEVISDGDVVLGTIDGNGALADLDWYRISVPAGKHTLTVDLDAYDLGSAADLTVYLYDQALNPLPIGCRDPCGVPTCVPCAFEGGIRGVEFDPLASYDSVGGETLYVQVLEDASREGPASWYAMTIRLEGE